jgi:hypothetical protein
MINIEKMVVGCCEVLSRDLPTRPEESGSEAGMSLTESTDASRCPLLSCEKRPPEKQALPANLNSLLARGVPGCIP